MNFHLFQQRAQDLSTLHKWNESQYLLGVKCKNCLKSEHKDWSYCCLCCQEIICTYCATHCESCIDLECQRRLQHLLNGHRVYHRSILQQYKNKKQQHSQTYEDNQSTVTIEVLE
jgi:hypothetical protein